MSARESQVLIEKKHFIWLIIIAGAYLMRVALVDRFCIAGDEWYTVESSEKLGTSYMAYPYFLLMKVIINLSGINVFILRNVSIFLALLGIGAMFYLGESLNNSRLGFLSAAVAATSAFQIMISLEIRYYGVYFFLTVISLLLILKYLKSNKTKDLISMLIVAVITIWIHFNMLFFWSGLVAYLSLKRFIRVKLWERFSIICFLAIFFFGVIYYKTQLFSLVAYLGYKNAAVISKGMIGWSANSFIKPAFALFSMVFGFNVSPLNYKFVIPFGVIILGLAIKGVISSRRYLENPRLFWVCFSVFPAEMLFLIIEPLSSERFAGILAPKHVMFLYPLYVLALALGVDSFKKRFFKKIALTSVLIFHFLCYVSLFNPAYSYYAEMYIDYRKTATILNGLDLRRSLFVIDNKVRKSLEFYNQELFEKNVVLSPWTFLEVSQKTVTSAPFVIFATNNWKEINGSKDPTYENFIKKINLTHRVVDGFVDYPFFFYIFERKKNTHDEVVIPYELYGYKYSDLHLPIKINETTIVGSVSLTPEKDSMSFDFSAKRQKQSMVMYCNLEDSEDLPSGAVVGDVVFSPSGKHGKIIKNKNAFDVFAELDESVKIPAALIAHTWIKQPLISSEQKFKGVHRLIPAHIYRVEFPLGVADDRVDINYTASIGELRIWNISNE